MTQEEKIILKLKEEQTRISRYPSIIAHHLNKIDVHIEIIKIIAGENFIFNAETLKLYNILINYFNGVKSNEYDLTKGIMIVGAYGTGKTSLFENIKKYLAKFSNRNIYKIVPSRIIVREFSKDGFNGLEKFSFNKLPNEWNDLISNPFNLCIDDLGTEEQSGINYGQKTDCISELIQDRYELGKSHNVLTHATSNLDPTQMANIYSKRIIDRFIEMFNIFVLTGKSLRK